MFHARDFFLDNCAGKRVFEPYEWWTNRIQRLGHLCYRQEHYTDGKLLFSDIFLIIIYLSHCYSVAWDRLINHLRLSVSVSVVAPTAAFYYSIFMKFCTVISGPEKQDRVCLQWKSDDTFTYFATIFTPIRHFQWESSNTTAKRSEDI